MEEENKNTSGAVEIILVAKLLWNQSACLANRWRRIKRMWDRVLCTYLSCCGGIPNTHNWHPQSASFHTRQLVRGGWQRVTEYEKYLLGTMTESRERGRDRDRVRKTERAQGRKDGDKSSCDPTTHSGCLLWPGFIPQHHIFTGECHTPSPHKSPTCEFMKHWGRIYICTITSTGGKGNAVQYYRSPV